MQHNLGKSLHNILLVLKMIRQPLKGGVGTRFYANWRLSKSLWETNLLKPFLTFRF